MHSDAKATLATAALAIVGSDRNHQGTSNMLSILWTILIGFIAGVIAKFVTPAARTSPKASFSPRPSALSVPWSQPTSEEAFGWYQAGQGQASSLASWAQCSSC